MEKLDLSLCIDYEKLAMKRPEKEPHFTGYILKNYDYCKNRKRPAVIVCPGGGYKLTSEREATPVALEYLSAGFSTFVLHYNVAPTLFPVALVELASAVEMVRKNADEWNIDADKIVVCGFSAGGHLAASLGVYWDNSILSEKGFTSALHKPNALVLAYPCITANGGKLNMVYENLLEITSENLEMISLEKHVTKNLPPVFLWHTFNDNLVPVENSMLFATAAINANIPTELHIYPNGNHGLSLATEIMNSEENVIPEIAAWINDAIRFIKAL